MAELNRRHIVKAISYRLFGSLVSTSAAWLLSHDVRITAGVTIIDVFGKLLLYYVHERVWDRIGWGRRAKAEVSPTTNQIEVEWKNDVLLSQRAAEQA